MGDLLFSTGIQSLDRVIQNLIQGDNVVLKVENLSQYKPFVERFVRNAYYEKKPIVYFRFANHEYLIPNDVEVKVFNLSPEKGFEPFLNQIISVIETVGIGACYVFDLLSDLSVDWYSDVMLGNFFMLTCPYLYKFDTIAYFALVWNHHTNDTVMNIQNTAQVVLDIFENEGNLYIHPLKLENRYSPTIFMLHEWLNPSGKDEIIRPLKGSAIISKILATRTYHWSDFSTKKKKDVWNITFNRAQDTLEGIMMGEISPIQADIFKNRLLKMAIVEDDLLFILAVRHFELSDILEIGRRLIGTGMIGGKSVGMLLAQKILKNHDPKWEDILEVQDSFYIGSEVYYSFLVKNKIWWDRRKMSSHSTFLEGIEETKQKISWGTFPEKIVKKFESLLDYFGQSPIIVRSSSIQEDAYGNSFSGKYESVFLPNQGTFKQRYKQFVDAIRIIYASSVSKDALTYRKSRGLLEKDEQMALLVQRVSGELYDKYFFPQAAGVGYSYNPYVWDAKIDPKAGVIRIVGGLGTRAVDRTDNDFSRIVSLNAPNIRPEHNFDDIRNFSQQNFDLIDLTNNQFTSVPIRELIPRCKDYPIELYASKDVELIRRAEEAGRPDIFAWVFSFEKLLNETRFIEDIREMMEILEASYVIPVDIEFTVNFFEHQKYKINLLQCRPFQVKKKIKEIKEPGDIPKDSIIVQTYGPIIGTSFASEINRIVYIEPTLYGKLPIRDRHSIARLVGKINNHPSSQDCTILLMGPGRWGTSSPSLGIPVNFAEINNINILCEIAEMHEGLIPDVSLGTHFFNNLVELDLLYFTLHPLEKNDTLQRGFFSNAPNQLENLLPKQKQWGEVIKVIDAKSLGNNRKILMNMNTITQKGYCYISGNISNFE